MLSMLLSQLAKLCARTDNMRKTACFFALLFSVSQMQRLHCRGCVTVTALIAVFALQFLHSVRLDNCIQSYTGNYSTTKYLQKQGEKLNIRKKQQFPTELKNSVDSSTEFYTLFSVVDNAAFADYIDLDLSGIL